MVFDDLVLHCITETEELSSLFMKYCVGYSSEDSGNYLQNYEMASMIILLRRFKR